MMTESQTEIVHAAPQVHLSGYQARDYEVVDYQMYPLDHTQLWFRGPRPKLVPGRYFTCIGAAQTLGCFCDNPFPTLLALKLGMPVLNLGYGGAGPEFFARQELLHEYINRSAFVVVQVMSGRSQSNSVFASNGLEYLVRRSDGVAMGANEAYDDLLDGPSLLRRLPLRRVRRAAARVLSGSKVRRLVEETRERWIDSHQQLLARIKVPTVLLWFSKRSPGYVEDLRNVNALFGEFPQLVNTRMVEAVRPLCGRYVECVTSRGSPQPLVSRFTGDSVTVDPARDRPDLGGRAPWTHNHYYPSPEMHEDAADALRVPCAKILSRIHLGQI